MLHFSKVIQLRQIRNKGLINYCENAAYYNTTPSLSITEEKKKKNTPTKKHNLQATQNKTKLTQPPPRSLVSAVKHERW